MVFKFGVVGLTEKSASLLVMTPPPATREPPRRGSLLPRPAEIRYPTSDSYPRPKAPSPRGLRPQAVGEFTVMGILTLSNSSINPNLQPPQTSFLAHFPDLSIKNPMMHLPSSRLMQMMNRGMMGRSVSRERIRPVGTLMAHM